ncbi:ATP-binding protein [Cellulophaga fucicola]|uniref:histidine kinase n=1 Tax=Cellulophaga fucicola TaxID=76595 RepID=A0A1K1N371_9FLAO|nr:ATP-binding protein [Cellulophaga fucicola]SFW29693.1 His Kinase A (phospho-acceptor) domain-containing protein [Cellulophaga fucicola]
MKASPKTIELRFSRTLILIIIAICVFPFILQQLGVNFGSVNLVFNANGEKVKLDHTSQDLILTNLRGTFTHLILEWTAICIAIATAILAFIQYRITNNPATPIIGAALLCAGFIDAFHALSAIKVIKSVSDNENFLPFTWAISRIFNSVILILGTSIFLFKSKRMAPKKGRRFVLLICLSFIFIAYLTVYFAALSNSLPQTTFQNSFITRPYDVIPLFLFLFMAIWLLPQFHKKENSVFSSALLWSMIPAIATQMYMVFGSKDLHDSNFNIAHSLKAISYLIPFIGITLDYITTHKKEQVRITELKNAQFNLRQKNKELEQFAYIASHDLQEPLRTVMNFTQLFEEEFQDKIDTNGSTYLNFIKEATIRMSALIKGLLDYSRIGSKTEISNVKFNKLLKTVKIDLEAIIKESGAKIKVKKLPKIKGHKTELRMLFQNLITNAIKFRKEGIPPVIQIKAIDIGEYWEFSVKDNGIGIEEKHKEKIFSMFQQLHSKGTYEGTGIGLAHSFKIVSIHKGQIWVVSEPNKGSEFKFTIKKEE